MIGIVLRGEAIVVDCLLALGDHFESPIARCQMLCRVAPEPERAFVVTISRMLGRAHSHRARREVQGRRMRVGEKTSREVLSGLETAAGQPDGLAGGVGDHACPAHDDQLRVLLHRAYSQGQLPWKEPIVGVEEGEQRALRHV